VLHTPFLCLQALAELGHAVAAIATTAKSTASAAVTTAAVATSSTTGVATTTTAAVAAATVSMLAMVLRGELNERMGALRYRSKYMTARLTYNSK
jgi:hypothetical protein